jgi:8-oxo-dGTP pyrophosphatase MutT (NUDIX family)
MNHRIRAAAIVVDDDRLLLVRHEIPEKGEVFWIPPGGGVEGEESIFECAAREVMEETGVEVVLDRVAYVRQWIDSELDYHHVEFFILAKSHSGQPSPGSDPEISLFTLMITDAKFLSRQELQEVTVYPEMLKHSFWDDFADGFPQMKYMGVDKD